MNNSIKIKEKGVLEKYTQYVVFENGDGTCYNMQFSLNPNGGINVIVNNNSCWLLFPDYTNVTQQHEIKFLFGMPNSWTKKAILQIANYMEW